MQTSDLRVTGGKLKIHVKAMMVGLVNVHIDMHTLGYLYTCANHMTIGSTR